ncbi:unnamed protein product, partial [Prorocentrum cordatum]
QVGPRGALPVGRPFEALPDCTGAGPAAEERGGVLERHRRGRLRGPEGPAGGRGRRAGAGPRPGPPLLPAAPAAQPARAAWAQLGPRGRGVWRQPRRPLRARGRRRGRRPQPQHRLLAARRRGGGPEPIAQLGVREGGQLSRQLPRRRLALPIVARDAATPGRRPRRAARAAAVRGGHLEEEGRGVGAGREARANPGVPHRALFRWRRRNPGCVRADPRFWNLWDGRLSLHRRLVRYRHGADRGALELDLLQHARVLLIASHGLAEGVARPTNTATRELYGAVPATRKDRDAPAPQE